MFEKRSDIRAKIRQQGVEQERRRISETLRRFGVRDEASGTITLTPEVMAILFDNLDEAEE